MVTSTLNLPAPSLNLQATVAVIAISSIVALLVVLLSYNNSSEKPYPGFPILGQDPSEKSVQEAKKRWVTSAKSMVFRAMENEKNMRPFQMIGTNGPLILIPPHYTAEIRGDERLTFKSWLKKDFFTNYPGFDGFKPAVENSVFIDSVRMGLTQSLASVVHMLAEETKSCLTEALPPKFDEWQEINFDTRALRIIARLSSRTFLPEPLCHNEEWLRIAVEYTVDFFKAAYVMRSLPAFVRPFVHWFLPQTRKLRGEVQKAREIIMPEVIARQKQAAADIKAGKKPKKYTDAIAWVEEAAEKNSNVCDPVNGQLNYSLGAVHTTAITFINTLYNIVDSPGSVELLREELIDVLGKADGWDKTTLNSLRMMDSYMKESNRMTPASFMTVNRVADQTISLSDGTVIPKGASLTIPNTRLYDSEFYENPDVFNGRRFYDMRMQPGNESKHQFVTTADHYLPFGHGKHACPGRFFASNEIKILLAHMLLGYDWKFPKDQGRPKVVSHGLDGGTNPKARILFKARVPEVSLDLDKKGVSWP